VGVLGVLAATAFSYGLVLAVGQQLGGLDPSRQQRLQVDGHVSASDGHTILAVLRGSQSRVLARTRLARLGLRPRVRFGTGQAGRVLSQEPPPGVAAAPGMRVRLVVARGG
jgi:hypothetical protein